MQTQSQEKVRLRRRVRVVTHGAGLLLNRIVLVRLFERALAAVVARHAQLRRRLRQEIVLGGRVGAMALLTSLVRYDLVFDLVLETCLVVALEADGVPFRAQEIGRIFERLPVSSTYNK